MAKYRLEIQLGNGEWEWRSNYSSAKKAWEMGEMIADKGKTVRLYSPAKYRVFKLADDGSYGAHSRVYFESIRNETIMLAHLLNGTDLEAWLI